MTANYCDFELFKNYNNFNAGYSDFMDYVFTAECGIYSQESKYSSYVTKNGDKEIHIIDDRIFYTLIGSEQPYIN